MFAFFKAIYEYQFTYFKNYLHAKYINNWSIDATKDKDDMFRYKCNDNVKIREMIGKFIKIPDFSNLFYKILNFYLTK